MKGRGALRPRRSRGTTNAAEDLGADPFAMEIIRRWATLAASGPIQWRIDLGGKAAMSKGQLSYRARA
jgi:hypothetical protein